MVSTTDALKLMGSFARTAEKQINSTYSRKTIYEHYYSEHRTATPIPIWMITVMFVGAIPAVIYSGLTGVETIPASNPVGAFSISMMLGSIVFGFLVHLALVIHGRYKLSEYTVRSPIVKSD